MLRRRPRGSLFFFAAGAASALVGLIPWIITGLRLPLQNLWATDTMVMPIALLPFSQYYIVLVASLIVVGSAIAGALGRLIPAAHPRRALGGLIGGVLLVQIVALVQTGVTVSEGLSDRSASSLYVTALVAGTIAAIALGLGMLVVIARAPRPGASVAIAVVALAFGNWVGAILHPVGAVIVPEPLRALITLNNWTPALIVGAAIAWAGVNTAGKVISAVSSLLVLWLGWTLMTAVQTAVGTRILAPHPAEMLEYGLQVFRYILGTPEWWGLSLLIAVAVAFIGVVARVTAAQHGLKRPKNSF